MKHILIVDLADDSCCGGCPCLDMRGDCLALPHDPYGGAEIIDYFRPNDCPLKPMPNRDPISDEEIASEEDYETRKFCGAFNLGWNNCLDEIGEDDEDTL